ncbi:MAG: hypothetical protein HZB32_05070 [Nitrospirae bacterium]|nr:hypothetical protein [Nitrospirota bacterium]
MIDQVIPIFDIVLFIAAAVLGGAVILREIVRRSGNLKELILTLITLACGAIPVNIFVFAPAGYISWPSYFWYLTLPSTFLALVILIYAYIARMEPFFNRYWVGIWVGMVGTVALDAVRLTGYKIGWMPYDVPRVAGTMIFDSMLTGPTPLSDLVGYLNHFWIGANIGFLYTLIFGRTHWAGSVLWLLFYEAGMMLSPAVIMMAGPFGLQFGYGILAVSFMAHVVFGVVQGLLGQRYVKAGGNILHLLSIRSTSKDLCLGKGLGKSTAGRC